MSDYNPEGYRADEEFNGVSVAIIMEGNLQTRIPRTNYTVTTAGQLKRDILRAVVIDIPDTMRNNPNDCELVYKDDTERVSISDDSNLLEYHERLHGDNSELQICYPRKWSLEQPRQDPQSFGISTKIRGQ